MPKMMKTKARGAQHVVIAGDVTAGNVKFHMGDFGTTNGYMVTVRTAAGVAKAWDGAAVLAGDTLTVDNAGATDWAATDVISVVAW